MPDFSALWTLLDRVLKKFSEVRKKRNKAGKLRRELTEIEERRRKEEARSDALVAASRAKLSEIKSLMDEDERRRKLAELDRENDSEN